MQQNDKKPARAGFFSVGIVRRPRGRRKHDYARSTLPAFMHFVQTFALRT